MSSLIFEPRRYLSPMTEMAAYEALWDGWRNISYRKLAMKFDDVYGLCLVMMCMTLK